jgi:hypothetical protein
MKIHFAFVLTLLLASLSTSLVADDRKTPATDREQVIKFLKDHVMGKTVATPRSTHKLDNDTMEADNEDQTTITNLTESAHGFAFDQTMVSKATRYDLGKDGKRILPGRDLSGTEVYRYEIVERVSTKKLTGTARLLSMTTKAPSRDGATMLLTGIKVADGKLYWNETLPGYLDFVAAGGKYKPGSWDATNVYSIEDGRLVVKSEYTIFDVDPDTLKRTPRADKIPPFVSKEITDK